MRFVGKMEVRGKNRKSIVLGSLSIILLVSSQYLNDIIGLYAGNDKGYFAPILAVSTLLGLVSIFFNRRIKRNRKPVSLLVIIFIAYSLTLMLQSGKSTLLFVDLIGMCVIPVFLGAFLIIDHALVFRGCMMMLLLAIPVFPELFLKANIGINYDAVSMSTSYDILPIVLVGVIHFIYFRKESTVIDKILYVISFLFTFSLIRMSYRGALVALVVAVAFALYFQKKQNSIKKQLLLIMFSFVGAICVVYYGELLSATSDLLHGLGIRVAFVDKSLYLLSSSRTDHGRLEVWRQAFNGFLNSPVIGHGMATFQYYTGYPFPHNFILEFLYDGGILLFFPIMYIFIAALRRLFQRRWEEDRYRFAFVLMIGCISVTRGLLSAESWRIVLLWLFIGMALNNTETVRLTDGKR